MPEIRFQQSTRSLFLLLVIAVTLPISGCIAAAVTAGVAGAGAAGYVWYQGGVPRDFPASMDQAWAGTQLALADLGMPVVTAVHDDEGATIESRTGDGDKVKITLEPRNARVPADGQWTHITVRVALLGDKPVTERIMNQIDTRLAPPGAAGQQPLQAQPAQPLNQTVAPPLAPH
jgi:Protein of unknown function (DUF3568)